MRNNKLSRRTFIRNTSLMTAGTIAGSPADESKASKNRTMRRK